GGGDQLRHRRHPFARSRHPARPGRRGGALRPALRASAAAMAGRRHHLPRVAGLLQHARRDRSLRRRPAQGAQHAPVGADPIRDCLPAQAGRGQGPLLQCPDNPTDDCMDDVRFRDATAADIDAIVALVTSAYRGEASRAGWTLEPDILDGNRIDPEVRRADIERPRSRVVLAERDGALLACAHVAEEDDAGYFGMFSVVPGLQGGGIGNRLLAECERIARDDWRLPDMRMTVIDIRDELIAFYERRGYRRPGTYKPFPHGDERFGIAKRDDLRFEVLEKTL